MPSCSVVKGRTYVRPLRRHPYPKLRLRGTGGVGVKLPTEETSHATWIWRDSRGSRAGAPVLRAQQASAARRQPRRGHQGLQEGRRGDRRGEAGREAPARRLGEAFVEGGTRSRLGPPSAARRP